MESNVTLGSFQQNTAVFVILTCNVSHASTIKPKLSPSDVIVIHCLSCHIQSLLFGTVMI